MCLLACLVRAGQHWHSTNGDSIPNASVTEFEHLETVAGVEVFDGLSMSQKGSEPSGYVKIAIENDH